MMINLILFVLHQERYGGDERRVGDHGGGAEQQATYGVNTALGQRKTQHAAKSVAEADVKMVDERYHAQEVEIVLRRIVLRRGRGRTGEIRQRRRENRLMVVIAAWSKQ